MFKAIIKKNNLIIASHKSASMEDIQAWVTLNTQNNSWGKPDRIVAEESLEKENEDVANSDNIYNEVIDGREIKFYHFPQEYVVEFSDTSNQDLLNSKISNRVIKRTFGEYLIDKISTINDSKNLSIEQVDAFMANPLVISLREHLWAGNITTFISKLQTSDVSAFFTTNEKNSVIAECQEFLTSLGE